MPRACPHPYPPASHPQKCEALFHLVCGFKRWGSLSSVLSPYPVLIPTVWLTAILPVWPPTLLDPRFPPCLHICLFHAFLILPMRELAKTQMFITAHFYFNYPSVYPVVKFDIYMISHFSVPRLWGVHRKFWGLWPCSEVTGSTRGSLGVVDFILF